MIYVTGSQGLAGTLQRGESRAPWHTLSPEFKEPARERVGERMRVCPRNRVLEGFCGDT